MQYKLCYCLLLFKVYTTWTEETLQKYAFVSDTCRVKVNQMSLTTKINMSLCKLPDFAHELR